MLCSGRVDPEWVLRALKKGIDGVIIAGCRLGECHFKYGNYKAKDRFEALREALKEVAWSRKGSGASGTPLERLRALQRTLTSSWRS